MLRPYYEFFRNADLLLFDAQYTSLLQGFMKTAWGHSSPPIGVDIAVEAGVKRIAFVHHDPLLNEAEVPEILRVVNRYRELTYPRAKLDIIFVYDGMEITP